MARTFLSSEDLKRRHGVEFPPKQGGLDVGGEFWSVEVRCAGCKRRLATWYGRENLGVEKHVGHAPTWTDDGTSTAYACKCPEGEASADTVSLHDQVAALGRAVGPSQTVVAALDRAGGLTPGPRRAPGRRNQR